MKPLESILRRFLDLHPEDAAKAFETLDHGEALKLFKSLPSGMASSLLERLTVTTAVRILDKMEVERVVELISAISMRHGASLVAHMEEPTRESLLQLLPERQASALRELAAYPAESAGAMMEPRVASLAIDLTAQQAISSIRKAPRDALHYLYVTKRDGELQGVLNMRDLLLASPRDPIEELVNRDVVSIPATMGQEEVVNLMRERRFLALPVVDFEGHLVGVVKHNEALQAGQDAAFEDLQKIVGAGADERALSPVSTVVKSRLPWLYVNLLTAFMAAAVIGAFEGIIAKIAALCGALTSGRRTRWEYRFTIAGRRDAWDSFARDPAGSEETGHHQRGVGRPHQRTRRCGWNSSGRFRLAVT